MTKKILSLGIIVLMFASLSSFSEKGNIGDYQKSDWEKLGVKKVNFGLDKDVLQVGKDNTSRMCSITL